MHFIFIFICLALSTSFWLFLLGIAISFYVPIQVRQAACKHLAEIAMEVKGSDESLEMADQTDEGKKWAEYLAKLNPDDFGKYKV